MKTVHIISTNIRVNLMEYRNLFLHESLRWYLGLLEAASTQHLHGIMVRAKNTSTVLTEIFYFSSKDVYGPLSSLWLEVPEDSHFEVFFPVWWIMVYCWRHGIPTGKSKQRERATKAFTPAESDIGLELAGVCV